MTTAVHIRPYRIKDDEKLQVLADDRAISDELRDGFPSPYTLDTARGWIAYNMKEEQKNKSLVIANEDDEFVGTIGVVAAPGKRGSLFPSSSILEKETQLC
jgi:ribosomal-protein-alanine N-acetyltransferase